MRSPHTTLGQFIHLAKSGGTTIKNGLRKWANSNDIRVSQAYMSASYYQPEVGKLRLWKHGLFQGHRGWGWSPSLAANALRVVVLREPVSRVISLFDYVKRSRSMFRRNSTGLFWEDRSLDEVAAHYNHTRETAFDSLLPAGDACEADKAFHHAIMHVLMYLAGFEYVWGPGPRAGDRVVPQRQLTELALEHVRECDVVAIFPGFETQLVPQLRLHLHWVPRDAASYFETHTEKRSSGDASTPSAATQNLLKRWLADEEEVFAEAQRVAKSRTALAWACHGAAFS